MGKYSEEERYLSKDKKSHPNVKRLRNKSIKIVEEIRNWSPATCQRYEAAKKICNTNRIHVNDIPTEWWFENVGHRDLPFLGQASNGGRALEGQIFISKERAHRWARKQIADWDNDKVARPKTLCENVEGCACSCLNFVNYDPDTSNR